MRQLLAGLSRRQAGDVAPPPMRWSSATGFAPGAPHRLPERTAFHRTLLPHIILVLGPFFKIFIQ